MHVEKKTGKKVDRHIRETVQRNMKAGIFREKGKREAGGRHIGGG